jgi:hypothetical protein
MPDRKEKAFAEEFVLGPGIFEESSAGLGRKPAILRLRARKQRQSGFVTIGTIFAQQLADKVSKKHLFGKVVAVIRLFIYAINLNGGEQL